MNNEELVKQMMDDISKECCKHTFDFSHQDSSRGIAENVVHNYLISMGINNTVTTAIVNGMKVESSGMRKPNEREIIYWMKDEFKHIYFTPGPSRPNITTEQYRSLKGEIMHGRFESVFNFLNKRNIAPNLRERMVTYANCESIQTMTVNVTFPGTVTREMIGIDIERKDT